MEKEFDTVMVLDLFSDGWHKTGRFAITDAAGTPFWANEDRAANQQQQEFEAAERTAQFAKLVQKAAGSKVVVNLKVDAQWLCYAQDTGGSGGQARKLRKEFEFWGIEFLISHIPGSENPADQQTGSGGVECSEEDNVAMGVAALRPITPAELQDLNDIQARYKAEAEERAAKDAAAKGEFELVHIPGFKVVGATYKWGKGGVKSFKALKLIVPGFPTRFKWTGMFMLKVVSTDSISGVKTYAWKKEADQTEFDRFAAEVRADLGESVAAE